MSASIRVPSFSPQVTCGAGSNINVLIHYPPHPTHISTTICLSLARKWRILLAVVRITYLISSAMALESTVCVVILCFFAVGKATVCQYDRDCGRWSSESCCSDSVCRKSCYYCSFDSDCGTGEECCDGGDCLSDCPSNSNSSWAAIVGGVLGTIFFFAIVLSIVACFCCACCPFYRNRSHGTVIMSQPAAHQTFVSTTTHMSTMSGQPVQHHPPPGPPPANYNQPPPPNYSQLPPPPGYDQATSPYNPSYPQQPPIYPPSPLQGRAPMPPPVKYY